MSPPTKNGTGAQAVDVTADPGLRDLALSYLAGGVSLVPCSPRTKRPDVDLLPKDEEGKPTWKPYQNQRATAATVKRWFARGCQSVAAIGGKVSGGLLIIDFDVARFYEAWKVQVGSLADGLPVQRTGREGGGYQVWFRCDDPGKNVKLAWVADETEETGRKCSVETRGEGGYAVMPGSLHPSGRRYEAINSDFAAVPTVPQAQADALLAAARKLDEAPLTRQQMEAREKAAETSERHRAESNGQTSVIDAYNERITIEAELKARRYVQQGDRWRRPGGKSRSVYVREGRSFHHSANDPLNDGYWHRPFDVFCELEHGGDCKAAVKAAAELLGMKASDTRREATGPTDQATDQAGGGKLEEPLSFTRLLTGGDLLALDLRPSFLVKGVLVERQPMIVGGRSKTLKTSLVCDLVVALGSGTPFLGRFEARRVGVGFWSGESGAATIRDTARRCAEARRLSLADTSTLWSFDLPRLSNSTHLGALEETIRLHGLKVAILDPLYLCLLTPETAGGASNLFMMGSLLQGLTRLGQRTNCTIILVHHFRKGGQPDNENPAGLEELAQSGIAEWARQWLLLQRRVPYQNDGNHSLWMRCGGSAGHSSLWGLNIDEGNIDPDTGEGRRWEVTVSPAADARKEAQQDKDNRKAADKEQREAEQRERLWTVLKTLPGGDSAKGLREAAGLNPTNFGKAIARLLQEGRAARCKVVKGKAEYDGFKPAKI
jgi:hypothetical protein